MSSERRSPSRHHASARVAGVLLVALFTAASFATALLASPDVVDAEARTVDSSREGNSGRAWIAVDRFLDRPRIRELIPSPDGSKIAALLREDVGASVWLVDPATQERRRLCSALGVESLHWLPGGGSLVLQTATRLAWLPLTGPRPTFFHHLDPETEQRFLEVDLTHPGHVLLLEKLPARKDAPERYRLLRVGVDGTVEEVHEAPSPIARFVLDHSGALEFFSAPDLESLHQRVLRLEGERVDEVLR